MKNINYKFFYFALIFIVYVSIYFYSFNIDFWADERHFVETIIFFSENSLLTAIKDYPEVTPPLFYIIYSTWGKIVGFETYKLRLFSLFLSFILSTLLVNLILKLTNNHKISIIISLWIMINPYVIGTGIFVYTDLLAFIFCITFLIGLIKGNIYFTLFSSVMMILTRQYLIIFPISLIIFDLISYKFDKQRKYLFEIIFLILSFTPYLILYIIWGGIAPKSGIDKWVIPNSENSFNFSAINSYLSFLTIYSLPFILIYFKKRYKVLFNKANLLFAIPFIINFLLFGVKASEVTIAQTNLETIGLVHRLIKKITYFEIIENIVLFAFYFIGIIILINLLRELLKNIKEKINGINNFFIIVIIIFLLIMPFSYQIWEKYLIPILPIFILLLYRLFISSLDNNTNYQNNY